ncbi:MAG: hypothetical protein ABI647_01935 [Gemmatimonadota bacterium]
MLLLTIAAVTTRCPARTDSVAVPGGSVYVEECGGRIALDFAVQHPERVVAWFLRSRG